MTMGKSISEGIWPTSFVFGLDEFMKIVKSYQPFSKFFITSMAVAAVTSSLQIHEGQKLQQRARDVHAK